MGYSNSGFGATIFWALVAYSSTQQGCLCGSGSQTSQPNSALSPCSVLPRLCCPRKNPPPSSCSPCPNSGRGGRSYSQNSYSTAPNQGFGSGVSSWPSSKPNSTSLTNTSINSATDRSNVPMSYQQPPCVSSQTYGSPSFQSYSTISACSLPSPSEDGSYTIYGCNRPVVASCPTPAPPTNPVNSPHCPIPTAPTFPPTLPPYPSTCPPSCCNGYSSPPSGDPSGGDSGSSTSMCNNGSSNSGSSSMTGGQQSSSGYQYSLPMLPTCYRGRNGEGSNNTCSVGYGSSSTGACPLGGNPPRTMIFFDPSGASTKICTLSSNGSYVCSSIIHPCSEGSQLCTCNTNNQNITPSPSTSPKQSTTCHIPTCSPSNCPTMAPICSPQQPMCAREPPTCPTQPTAWSTQPPTCPPSTCPIKAPRPTTCACPTQSPSAGWKNDYFPPSGGQSSSSGGCVCGSGSNLESCSCGCPTQTPSTGCNGYNSSPTGSQPRPSGGTSPCPSAGSGGSGSSSSGSTSYACPSLSPPSSMSGCQQLSSGYQYSPCMLPKCCRGRNAGGSYSICPLGYGSSSTGTRPFGYSSSSNSGKQPQTFCDPSVDLSQICSISSDGSYVCSSTSPSSGGFQPCARNNNNQNATPLPSTSLIHRNTCPAPTCPPQVPTCSPQPPTCPAQPSTCSTQPTTCLIKPPKCPPSSCPIKPPTWSIKAPFCPPELPFCPTQTPSCPPQSSSCPTQPFACSSSQTSSTSTGATSVYTNPYPQAVLCESSGNEDGGNRVCSCYNILTGPSCTDPCSNQSACMINNSGNGWGGNTVCSQMNCIFGGSMVKNSGNGYGGNTIKSCCNIMGGNADKVMSDETFWKNACNIIIGCQNCSSPFCCPSLSYDDDPNNASHPCSCSEGFPSQDSDNCDYSDTSENSCPPLPQIIIYPQFSECPSQYSRQGLFKQ